MIFCVDYTFLHSPALPSRPVGCGRVSVSRGSPEGKARAGQRKVSTVSMVSCPRCPVQVFVRAEVCLIPHSVILALFGECNGLWG